MKRKNTPHKKNFLVNTLTLCYILASSLLFNSCKTSTFEVIDFQSQFISNIDNRPIFTWKVDAANEVFYQSACQIIIADNKSDIDRNIGNVWNSGKKNGLRTYRLKYSKKALINGQKYYAKIKLWDNEKTASSWSKTHRFFVPINYPEHWKAKWISYEYHPESALPVFKKTIKIENKKTIESARLYIAAPGFYEAFLNGKKIGENVLDPGQTNYEDYTYYTAYDLSLDALQNNPVLGIMLGNGWYNQNKIWGKGMIYGQPVFMAQLIIQYKNGAQQIIGTDKSWKWKPGPITFSNIYAGESYNANLEVKDWFNTESNNAAWKNALLAKKHPTDLLEQFAEPIQKMDSIDTKGIISKGDGRYIFDFGQNFAGWVKLKIEGKKGQEITIRCVEELDEAGEIDPRTTGIRATKVIQTQKYICKGEGVEVWEPKFTYFGFRYVEVQGLSNHPSKDLLKGIVVYSSLPETGEFTCSEPNINKLHELANRTIKSNIHGIPTDCPHREKCGWTGDSHAFIHSLMYNFDAQRFVGKYIFDMRSSARNTNKELYFGTNFHDRSIINKPKGVPTMIVPGRRTSGVASPDWGTAMTQLPWNLHLYYGDTLMLNNFYPDMKVWVDYIQAKNEDGIITHGLGDWCPPGGNKNIDCPVPISSTAYHILDLKNIAQAAYVLGNEKDYEFYSALHKKTIASFNRQFLDTIHFTYGSQTADVMALEIAIVPEKFQEKVAASVVKNMNDKFNGFINTGIFGISRIFKVLAENGFEDEVYRLLSKTGENSFAYMWEHYDATTLWEVLPVKLHDDEELYYRSHSHPMQAGYDAWFYSGIAGINPSPKDPGFKKIVFKPYLTHYLENAKASYKSPFGTIKSAWANKGGEFLWSIKIPQNSKGEIMLPTYKKKVSVTINGKPLEISVGSTDFTSIGEYGPGNYTLKMNTL